MPNGVVQQQNHTAASHQQQGPDPYRNPIYISPTRDFIPTWKNLLPMRQEQTRPQKNHAKAFQLTLLNVSEFTITPLRVGDEYTGHMTSLAGLRGTIKRVSKDHGNAFFEQDPDGGKWHIPLGAYHAFVGFLRNDPLVVHIEGISEAQLKIASLGKARLEKEFPSARKLVKFGVPKKLADTLAPFQRGGVDFVIEKEGRALIADEMGLGKTIQGIASMAVFHEEWPLLVLCPSSARYHWESEFRSWLGKDSATAEHAGAFDAEEGKESEGEDEDTCEPRPQMPPLEDNEINVLTSGQDPLFPHQLTKVVICSYGLAPNLASSGKILPGMFRCAIVDESHMLKNKATQRTKNLLPVLKAMSRCVLLSGTPAFARPTELWPQLDILGCKRHGWWQDEAEFMKKYARGSKQRRAELHTMLLGTVMIRRMKNDILKTLPAKVREQGVVDVMDDSTRTEMKQCMATLRSGNGKLSELARGAETEQEQGSIESQASTNGVSAVSARRDEEAAAAQLRAATAHLEQEMEQYRAEGRRQIQHTLAQNPMDQMTMQSFAQQMESRLEDQLRSHYKEQSLTIQREIAAGTYSGPGAVAQPDPASEKKLVLNHMYTLTGKCKTPLVVEMLKRWLNDPTKGKLCIFAHHISVLDELVAGAGLSNATESSTKYIRIDGSTTPRSRQDQINTFQRDSSVRIAILGITAAGVAVTLTASSTVWFAELFWTPAIMVQAEDRCHRIGQQAQVKCLYFVAKGTLDELLWKLLENKFQSLGEFVEGKEKLKIVVNNTYHSSHELLKTVTPDTEEENLSDANSECSLSDVQEISSDLEHEIEELGLSEQKLLATGEDSEDFEAGNRDEPDAKPAAKDNNTNTAGASIDEAICLSDDDEDVEEGHPGQSDAQKETGDATDIATIPQQAVAKKPAVCDLKTSTFPDLRIYRLYFSGPRYGIHFSFIEGRLVVAGTDDDRKQRFGQEAKPHIGEVLVGINRQIVPPVPDMKVVLSVLATEKSTNNGITELMFAEDSSIKNHMIETITRERDRQVAAAQQPAVAAATANVNIASDGVIEID
jgi:SWI/SNF-related matrix-associated actin-dependent regulator 1 of chromatin subfamily A